MPHFPAQVLILSSDEAFLYHRPSFDLHRDLMQERPAELQLCAVTIDHYRTSDLNSLPLDRYRLVIILNSFEPDSDAAAILTKGVAAETPILWMYASGRVHGDDPSGLPLKAFMPPPEFGIKFGNLPERRFLSEEHEYPMFGIDVSDSEDITVLARYSDGTPAAAECRRNGRLTLRVAVPLLSKFEFREILRRAGIQPYREGFAACYGNDRFHGIFEDGGSSFEFYEKLPGNQSRHLA